MILYFLPHDKHTFLVYSEVQSSFGFSAPTDIHQNEQKTGFALGVIASEIAKQGTAIHLSRLAKVWSDILGKETLNQTLGLLIAKIPRFLFPDIMAYLNNNEHVKLFEMARKICRVSSHDSQST